MPDLIPNWPAPKNVRALTTTRSLGVSLGPYTSNNLGLHVGDNATHVQSNRENLVKKFALPGEPEWLEQTHTNHCVIVEEDPQRHADASITRSTTHALAIMTADCLPIILCNNAGTEIAAIHAGWRGLLNGIVENTLNKMQSKPETCMAWIGPAICQRCYETGLEVQEAYTNRYPFTKDAFHIRGPSLHADLPKLAELILQASGITAVYQSNACTFELENEFYSYRREAKTGRMATLIWFNRDKT